MVHIDIKPQNIFATEKNAVLADFGGSRLKTDSREQKNNFTPTPGYSTDAYVDAMHGYNKASDADNWFQAGKAYDLRATGLALYEIFTGKEKPNELADPNFYSEMENQLTKNGIPEDAVEILIKMCKPMVIGKPLPAEFPSPVTDAELQQIEDSLRGVSRSNAKDTDKSTEQENQNLVTANRRRAFMLSTHRITSDSH
jgi:serine/threonine protein kinase